MVRKTSLWPIAISFVSAIAMAAMPAAAQIQPADPDTAIDGDLMGGSTAPPSAPAPPPSAPAPADAELPALPSVGSEPSVGNGTPVDPDAPAPADAQLPALPSVGSEPSVGNGTPVDPAAPATTTTADPATTYRKNDLIGAAEGIFGKGAKGLAQMIEDLLEKRGEPNGYIVGREGGGAFVLGLRYGSGTLHHKVEGERPVYWTGPSIGFDAGANAANAFMLVYNLHDTQDLFKRYVAGEGQAYFIGGLHVSYLRHGDIVLIPVRMGAGLRLGINAGYMKFSHKQNWLPF